MSGFVSAEGNFFVNLINSKTKVGKQVILIFSVTQHSRDELLLKSLVNFFGSGQTYSYKDYIEFRCQSFNDNYDKILPFFCKYPILGVKSHDFND